MSEKVPVRFDFCFFSSLHRWISVLNNAKEEVLLKAFRDSSESHTVNQSVRELTSSIVDRVRKLPGNKYCCDCNASGRRQGDAFVKPVNDRCLFKISRV